MMTTRDGRISPRVVTTAPTGPYSSMPIYVARFIPIGPGVLSLMASML